MKTREKIERVVSEKTDDMFKFLREMISIYSTSCNEEKLVHRIQEEMELLNYDEIVIDDFGNILGRIGDGPVEIAMDAHIDTVDVGERNQWTHDPFEGYEDDQLIYGRGASDQEGGFAAIVYAGAIIKELDLAPNHTIWITGTIQEEDCDGLCWQYILENNVINPSYVVITEPTSLNVYRGHRGRMEIKVDVKGVSAHGSAPERGENAIYKMASIIKELEALNERLTEDAFLGKGTLVVSEIASSAPSRCAVADGASISIDRRLTKGETYKTALEEIKALPSVQKHQAKVQMYQYNRPSYKGYQMEVDSFFPTWTIGEDHHLCKGVLDACDYFMDEKPLLDKWTFSTNGVSIMGRFNIPCIGFGPGHEEEAHAPNEKILKEELVKALKVYTMIPKMVEEAE